MGTSRAGAVVALLLMISTVNAQVLTTDFYDDSCPRIYSIVKQEVAKAVKAEKRMAASLIRLHFHDCFVNGCDGSLLLDSSTTFVSEKFSLANNNSVRGFEVIDTIKSALESACPNTVSCADVLAITSRDSAVEVGLSESYPVYFGRRDSLTASIAEANLRLPAPFNNYAQLVQTFAFQGLNEKDLIALSGAHTIGRVKCSTLNASSPAGGPSSLNDPNINSEYRVDVTKACLANTSALQNLDLKTPDKFDNNYFKNLRRSEGILTSDQTLQSTPGPNVAIVKDFAQNKESFLHQFGLSSIKMGNTSPLTGNQGEIRTNCRVVNPVAPAIDLVAFE